MEELELLQAMYMDDCKILSNPSETFARVQIELAPSLEEAKCFVKCTLTITIPKKYPSSPPQFHVSNVRGLEDSRAAEIVSLLKKRTQENAGVPILLELVELAKEFLVTLNIPRTECMVCLCLMEEDEADEFMKTHCFHYFHRACLAEWFHRTQKSLLEKAREKAALNLSHKQSSSTSLDVPCPHCRAPLDDSDMQLFSSALDALRTRDRQEEERAKEAALKAEAEQRLQEESLQISESDDRALSAASQEAANQGPVPLEDILEKLPCCLIDNITAKCTAKVLKAAFDPYSSSTFLIHNFGGARSLAAMVFFPAWREARAAVSSLDGKMLPDKAVKCFCNAKESAEALMSIIRAGRLPPIVKSLIQEEFRRSFPNRPESALVL